MGKSIPLLGSVVIYNDPETKKVKTNATEQPASLLVKAPMSLKR